MWSSMLGGQGDDDANAIAVLQGTNGEHLDIFVAGTLEKLVENSSDGSEEVQKKYNRDAILYKFMENG